MVIFVESLRWLGIRWGLRPVSAGFRRAGFTGEFRYWRFHETWRACLILPVVAAPGRFEREARRLAEFITAARGERPDRPIYLVGYSAGGYLAVRALELLDPGVTVDGLAILAGALSPWRDLSPAARACRRPPLVVWSWGDWFLLGLGTLIMGTCDRRHSPAMGMIGPRGPGRPAVRQIAWRPAWVRLGHFGGHFGAPATGFIARYVAPALGVERA